MERDRGRNPKLQVCSHFNQFMLALRMRALLGDVRWEPTTRKIRSLRMRH